MNFEEGVKSHICPLCKNLMRNPIQTTNGTRACKVCFQEAYDGNLCPIDGVKLPPPGFWLDKFTARGIQNLRCGCDFCDWKGIVENYQNHPCKRKRCPLCFEESGDILSHLASCPKVSTTCETCGFRADSLEVLNAHMRDNDASHTILKNHADNGLQTRIDSLTKDLSKANEKVVGLELVVAELEKTVKKLKRSTGGETTDMERLEAVELQCKLIDNSQRNSSCVWSIDDYSERLANAKSGRISALHSHFCYTGDEPAYKFCFRFYPNGDGMGRNTHASIYFVLCKGKNDGLLKFPFNAKVIMSIKGKNGEDVVRETFHTDLNSSSFSRPTNDMNIAAGCPKFIRQEKLDQQCVVDDVISIVCKVERLD